MVTRFGWLFVGAFVLWVVISDVTNLPYDDLTLQTEKFKKYNTNNISSRFGNINGTPFSIPSNYLFFPVEYLDKSIWEPSKDKNYYKNKTTKDAISNFSIHVHWPSLKPRSRENEKSYLESRRNKVEHQWLVVNVQAINLNAPYYTTQRKDNSLSRVLRSHIEEKGTRTLPDGVKYVFKGKPAIDGLSYAVPEGTAAEVAELWNKKLYWIGDIKSIVTTSIHCPNGKFPNPKLVGKCIQYFEMPEIKAIISVRYRPNMRPNFEDIQLKVTNLILSFKSNSAE